MNRKLPTRPTNEITQQFNSGVVALYNLKDTAQPGKKPIASLGNKIVSLRYEELKLGINRHHLFLQDMVKIARVIRCPFRDAVSSQCVAIDESGKQYKIELVQLATDIWPKSMDLTLSRIEQKFEVPQ